MELAFSEEVSAVQVSAVGSETALSFVPGPEGLLLQRLVLSGEAAHVVVAVATRALSQRLNGILCIPEFSTRTQQLT
jgi:hypothetical protein